MKLRHTIFAALLAGALANTIFAADKIDRRSVVERHNIRYGGYNARLNDSPNSAAVLSQPRSTISLLRILCPTRKIRSSTNGWPPIPTDLTLHA